VGVTHGRKAQLGEYKDRSDPKSKSSGAREKEERAGQSHEAVSSDDDHHAPLPRQWAIAGLVLLPEWYACYLGGEAFGQGRVLTALFATIMVVVLGGCEYWYDSAVRHEDTGQKKFALGMLAALILGLGGLRFYYGWIVENQHSILGALLLAVVLSIVTTALVAFGCFALYYSESIAAWKMRRAHKKGSSLHRVGHEG